MQISQRVLKSNKILPIIILVAALILAVVLPILPQFMMILVVLTLIGLPFTAFIFSSRTRPTIVIILLVLLPLTGILKAVIGSRFAPLIFDLGILAACLIHLLIQVFSYKIRLGKLDFVLFAVFLIAFIQIFNPNIPNLLTGVEGFRKFAFMSITFYAGRHILSYKDVDRFTQALILLSIPIALYGLKQFIYLSPLDEQLIAVSSGSRTTYLMGGWVRPFSTLSGPFHLGLHLIVASLLIISYIRYSKRFVVPSFFLYLFLIVQVAVLLMTRTKGNWIGFVAGLVVLIFLQSRKPVPALLRILVIAIVGGLAIGTISYFSSGRAQTVIQEAFDAVTNPLEAPTFVYRSELWGEEIIPAISNQPFLGYGTGSAGEGLKQLFDGTSHLFFPSHNLYFKIMIELGVIGFLFFTVLIFGSIVKGFKSLWATPFSKRLILTWSMSVVTVFLVAGLVYPSLDAYPANYYFWLLLGLSSRSQVV